MERKKPDFRAAVAEYRKELKRQKLAKEEMVADCLAGKEVKKKPQEAKPKKKAKCKRTRWRRRDGLSSRSRSHIQAIMKED